MIVHGLIHVFLAGMKTISELLKDIGMGVYAKVFEDNMVCVLIFVMI